MAYETKDGKKFTNRPPMMAHNRSMERGGGIAEKTDPLKQPGQESGEEDVAAEHGPAHEIHMMHDREGGRHHVHSMHPDGHEHHSDHGSAEEAHEHAKKCAGCGMSAESEGDGMGEPEYE